MTFLLKEIKMSRLLHFETLDYPIQGKISKKFWKFTNKFAHGGHYKSVFDRIPLGVPQCPPCWNKVSSSGYVNNDHIFINNNDIQSQSV